ncbi:MAG: hypothetical protein L7R84_04205 [Balneolaceae bacterium]|nr:hypothetical protein [Balneolaceae bacterium]
MESKTMIILFLLIAGNAFFLNLVLPWWSAALPGLFFGYRMNVTPIRAFGMGFFAVFLAWGAKAPYGNIARNGVLSSRMAELFGLTQEWILILITAVIGGLLSGFATLTSSLLAHSRNKK